MSDELARQDDLGLTYDGNNFTYQGIRPPPRVPGKLHERADLNFLAEVPYRPLEWLWEGRIPCNKLTLIEGPAQSGKSLVTLDLAARASRGAALPEDENSPVRGQRILLISGYDDLHDTVLPRIRRAGGDLGQFCQNSKVNRSRGDEDPFAQRKLKLPDDIQHVELSIINATADVVIVDPLACFCRTGHDVSTSLELLEDLASRIGIPIIATLPATTSRDVLGNWVSKPAFTDTPARCVWSIVVDPYDAGRRLFVPTRMTFATPREGLAYRIVDDRIAWEPLPELPAAELDETMAWLASVLEEGEMRGAMLLQQAKEVGISGKALRRAGKQLGVDVRRGGNRENATSYWSLPYVITRHHIRPGSEPVAIGSVAESAGEPQGLLAGPEGASQTPPPAT